MIFEFISPRICRRVAILVGRRENIKRGERDFSRSRVNHGLLSSPTVYPIIKTIPIFMFFFINKNAFPQDYPSLSS
jgi:hypothetical protein